MIRNLRRWTAAVSVMAYSVLSAQGICDYSETSTGADNSNYVEFNNFDCVDTVTNSFVTGAVIDFSHTGSSWMCTSTSWYSFDLEVNGTVIAEDICEIDSTDLAAYGVDINNLTSVKIVSKDNNSSVNTNTIEATLDLSYIITTCPPPTGITASTINPTTADVSWSSNGSETLWNIEVVNLTTGDTATGVATYSGVSVNPYVVTSLLPENEYAVYVQADCGVFNTEPLSGWSSALNFTTPPTCLPLGAISIDSVTDTTVDLSWAQAGSETSWDIELINTSNIPADTFTYEPNYAGLSTNAPTLTALVPESDYQMIVRANCGLVDGPSVWTSVYNFTTLPTCQAPVDLIEGDYTNNQIEFSWTAIDNEAMWYVEYVNLTLSETATGIADDSTTSTSYTALNLDGNSEYALYVSAACGVSDGNSYWSGPLSVTTLCNPVTMPFNEPFNTWIPQCFEVDNGDGDWIVYATSGDTVAAKARNTWGNYADHRNLQTPMINMDQQALLTFNWSHDDSNNDTLKVRLSDDAGITWNTIWSVTEDDFESNDGAGFNSPGSYKEEFLLIDNSYVGSDVMIDFDYASMSNTSNDAVFIDSIAVTALPACNIPYDLALDSVHTTSVDMSFTVAGTGATLYEIEIVESINTPTGVATNTATGTPFTVSGLNSGTNYNAYVRTMCGTDSTIWIGPIAFTTVCAPVVDYATSFEGYNTLDVPNCWNFLDSTSSGWSYVRLYNSTSLANTGTGYIRYSHPSNAVDSTSFQFIVLPELTTVSAQDHRLRFYAKQGTNDGNTAVVGTMSDPTDVNTFTALDSFSLTTQYVQYAVNFDSYTGTDTYVAIQIISGSGSGSETTYLDDIEWHEIPNCFPPSTVTIDSTSTTTISVSLDSVGTFGTEWFIEMVDVTGTNPTVLDTAYSTSFTVDGLMPSTVYEMTISTNCPDAISESTTMTVQTDCAPVGDFFNGFEDLNAGADTSLCWDYTVIHNSTSTWSMPYIDVESWNACDGDRFIRMYSGDDLNADVILVTPELTDINAGTHILTFLAKNGTNSSWTPASPFEVGTITDANDPSTFTAIYNNSVHGSTCDSITVPFLSYTGTDTRIAIKFNGASTGDNLYIDNMKWGVGPDCSLPVNFTATDVLDTQTTLDWLNVSPDTVWHIELVDALDTLDVYDSIPTDTAFAHPYLLTGLTENTIYDVYLSNPCDTAYNAIQVTFVTPWGNNLGINAILSPATSACNTSDSSQIEIEIENFGGQMATGFPVELSWDDSIYFNVGTFMDTLQPGQSATFILDGYYDFSTANDSSFWVQTALAADSVPGNDVMGSSVTNLGNMFINVQINTGNYGGEAHWAIWDTINNILADTVTPNTYTSYNTYNHQVCVYEGGDYIMNAWDTFDDGWNGGTYSITRCGGIILANNDGNEVTNGTGGIPFYDLEVQEGFHVTPCPDDDLAVMSIDGYTSSCGLGSEIGSVTLINFGNNDVAANGATAQYQFNNSGLWINFWDFSEGLASQADTVLDIPAIDMSIGGIYTIAVKIVYALDSDLTSNELSTEVTSVPTLTEDSAAFEMDNGFWHSEVYGGVANSWEHGLPTTSNIGNNNDGKVWALNLTGDAALNEQTYLYSPCYDISGYTEALEVSFDYVRTGSAHSITLSRSFDGGATWSTWSTWGTTGFPQSNTTDWTHKAVMLPNSVDETEVIFRWRYNSSWSNPIEGFGFDNWEVKEHVPYTDATLSDLEVANSTVTDPVTFDPAVLDYNYEVPYGSTNYNVTASSIAPFYTSITIDQVSSLPDTAFVTIIAEDTTYSTTYSVYITEEPAATDATLTSLSVSNSSVPGFNSDTLCYTITYPFGSTFMPSVVAVTNDPNATFVINNVNVPGTATIVVTAEDGVTVNTYCINYEVETLSSNAFLSDILLDAVSITGFVANTYTYYVELPNGTASIPFVTYPTADANAIVNYTAANLPLTDTATIEVTAQDGITMLTYYVIFTEAPSSNANLLDLTINGGTVTGFASGTLVYDVEIPYNSPIPNLGALAEDTTANIVVDNAIIVPGTTIITVTAEDGTVLTYYINWTYAAASNVATLDSLMTDAGLFCIIASPDTLAQLLVSPVDENAYTLTVGTGSNLLVTLTAIPTDGNATVVITGTATMAPYGELIITVTAEDNNTIEIYTVQVISENCSIGLDETVLGQISVSPNPSNGIFFIATPADLNNYTLAVVDQLGKMVYEEAVIDASMEKVIDLSTLPAGMYNLRINTANESIVKRISIIK